MFYAKFLLCLFKIGNIVFFIFCYGYYFRINTRYYYQNVIDGRTQWQYPNEESECASSSPVLSKASTPPPNILDLNTSHPEPIDMDIEDDNHKEDTEIIVVCIKFLVIFVIFLFQI